MNKDEEMKDPSKKERIREQIQDTEMGFQEFPAIADNFFIIIEKRGSCSRQEHQKEQEKLGGKQPMPHEEFQVFVFFLFHHFDRHRRPHGHDILDTFPHRHIDRRQ